MATGTELVTSLCNTILKDKRNPTFDDDEFNIWQNTELLAHINEAEQEACLRARLITDSVTEAVCKIELAEDTALYDVHAKIITIERTMLVNDGTPIDTPIVKKSSDWMDRYMPGWETKEGTSPFYFTWDGHMRKLRVTPVPDNDNQVLWLRVHRLPLADITVDTEPEIHAMYHSKLLHWAAHLAYLKPNSNSYDSKLADRYAAKFAAHFGQRPDAGILEERRRGYSMKSPVAFF